MLPELDNVQSYALFGDPSDACGKFSVTAKPGKYVYTNGEVCCDTKTRKCRVTWDTSTSTFPFFVR